MSSRIPVKEAIAAKAEISSLDQYHELYRRSLDEPDAFWLEQSERLDWFVAPGKGSQRRGAGTLMWWTLPGSKAASSTPR